MALTYSGVTTWAQSSPEQWHLSAFGLDTVTVAYSGPETGRAAFALSLNRWDPWSGDSAMFLSNWSNSGRKTYPQIDVQYTGCKGGILPPPHSARSFSVQTVSTSATDTATGDKVSGQFMFYAPCTHWRWVQNYAPGDSPLYTTMTSGISPRSTLFRAHVTIDPPDPDNPNMIPYSSYIAAFNGLTETQMISQYETDEVVPSRYWECSATVIRTLLGN